MDLRGRTLEEKFAAYCLQGIANREGPRVMLKVGADCHWMRFQFEPVMTFGNHWNPSVTNQFARRYESIEDAWREYYSSNGVFRFEPVTLEALAARLAPSLKGCVLYDRIADDCGPVATLAGLEDAVPLTAALRDRWGAAGVSLPVAFDYRRTAGSYPAGENRRLAGHRWLIDQLLSRCRKDGAVSRVRTYGSDLHDTIVDVDQAVQNRWVVYDLDHSALDNKSGEARKLTNDPPDRLLLDAILSPLDPFSIVYGWGRPGEESFIRSLNRNGLMGECSGVPNNSFFARVPATHIQFRQKRPPVVADQVAVEDKVYLAFMVNEGDSIKCMNGLGGFGCWLQPERGTIPINWASSPTCWCSHPGLMSYFYDTATTNDYFFAPASGWGYSHPSYIPRDLVMPYAAKVGEGMALGDLRFIDIWYNSSLKEGLQPFLQATRAAGMTDWNSGEQSVTYTNGGVTVIKGNNYYTYDTPGPAFAARLTAELKDVV